MAVPVPMLALSPTMTEGTIAAWKFKEGDEIKRGAVLCEVETDKAVMDYEAGAQGTLLKIVAPAGSSVKVGDLIAVIGTKGEDITSILAQASAGPQTPSPSSGPSQPAKVEETTKPVPNPKETPPISQKEPVPAIIQEERQASAPVLQSGIAPSSPLARKLAQQAGIDLRQLQGSGPGGR
ncbi:MAG TPA: E3 binding domain-containing protein, partial [Treponema sp.]|nr:E3 binding domain-containing protein [Treponema sp.]